MEEAGQFTITVVGYRDNCPDVDTVARGIDNTLDSPATPPSGR